ncbi:MAG: hypothetical protein IJ685_04260 [Selenomonadaceae bacterium]|nr:hypothetical protein [Selenomonadaceae bacterium]
MRIGEVLGLLWSDINFAEKQIRVRQQLLYLPRQGIFLSTLKTKSSNRDIFIDDFLLNELKCWQLQQIENENSFGNSYVYVYRESNEHLERRSKSLPVPDGEKVSPVCTRNNGRIVLHNSVEISLKKEG